MKAVFVGIILSCGAVSLVANSITGASSATGTIYNALSLTDVQTSSQLANSIATATFSDGSQAQCVFGSNAFCTVSGGFTILLPGGDTNSAAWFLINNHMGAGVSMTTLTINLAPGSSAFNPCLNAGSVGTGTGTCSSAAGGIARSVSTDTSNLYDSSASTASATVAYANAVKLGAAATSSDLFTQITLTFSGSYVSGTTFTFLTDTDLLGSGGGGATPEPTTMSLVGFALLGLGVWHRRRKTSPIETH